MSATRKPKEKNNAPKDKKGETYHGLPHEPSIHPVRAGTDQCSIPRRFRIEDHYPAHTKPEDIECHDQTWVFMACPESDTQSSGGRRRTYHLGCIIIAIAGACSNSGDNNGVSSAYTFLGAGNPQNVISSLDCNRKHTTEVAELGACIEALNRAVLVERWRPFGKVNSITIKSSSEYVVLGMTERTHKWRENGWKTAAGEPVENAAVFKHIAKQVDELEAKGVKVQFWLVPAEDNKFAQGRAQWALENHVPATGDQELVKFMDVCDVVAGETDT
ncbi:ribonuclease H-like domain-containing protein [Aspergillus unguis]